MKFRYSIACPTLTWMGYDVVSDPRGVLVAIKDAGYQGADLPVEGLSAQVVRPIVQALGLGVPEIMGEWGYMHSGEDRNLASSDAAVRQRGIDYSRSAIDLAVELEAKFFNVCAAQPPRLQLPFPETSIARLRSHFKESLASICEYAAARDIIVLLEPLNPYEGIPGVLTSVFDAIRLIDELGFDNLGVQPDIFHMNISEASVTDALRAAGRRAKVVHVNETNHYRLGTGHADYPGILRTLKDSGFNGYLTVYAPVISQDVFRRKHRADRPDLTTALAEQLQFLQQIEYAIDAQKAIYEH